jgi:NAD(P)-dependent dehydrogenase (short-subunit alcohol dehydrogenase family)
VSLEVDLSGRNALVSGVTSGIGFAIARKLAFAGCNVAGCGRRPAESEGARAFVDAVESADRRAVYVQCDISEEDAPARFVEATRRELGEISVVVSNAGRNMFEGAADCTVDAWRECMDLDLRAHWLLAREARASLKAAGDGVVIVISSNHAFYSIPGCFPYNIAKAGMNALVQSLAIEWGPEIRAVSVAPGFIDTPGNETYFESLGDAQKARRETEAMHPTGRIGTPDEIGALCAFLCSSYAAFINGVTITVDGGRSALMQDSETGYGRIGSERK